MNLRPLLALMISVFMMACSAAVTETSSLEGGSALITTPTPSYSCADYEEFDSLAACQGATFANCDWQWRLFPTGGTSLCYAPYAGWESCVTTPATWIYTTWNMSCRDSGSIYKMNRSTVSCSSATCACLDPQVTASTCTDGVNCPFAIPNPSPTPGCP